MRTVTTVHAVGGPVASPEGVWTLAYVLLEPHLPPTEHQDYCPTRVVAVWQELCGAELVSVPVAELEEFRQAKIDLDTIRSLEGSGDQ